MRQQNEEAESVIIENDKLREQLRVKSQELQTFYKEKADHPEVLAAGDKQEIIDLKNRAHLLSEENEVLFK